jgi:hypothetical protein
MSCKRKKTGSPAAVVWMDWLYRRIAGCLAGAAAVLVDDLITYLGAFPTRVVEVSG